jgi:hypothetical protein
MDFKKKTFKVHTQKLVNVLSVIGGIWPSGVDKNDTREWSIDITEYKGDRNSLQNRFMWHWTREISEQDEHKQTAKKIHALSKLEVLLPLYLSWDGKYHFQGAVAQDAINSCNNTQKHDVYDIQTYVADRMLRTSNLTVKLFAEYLTCYEMHWVPLRYMLTTSDDLYFEAMGVNR